MIVASLRSPSRCAWSLKVSRWVPVRPVISLVTLVFTTTRARVGHRSAGRPVSQAQATAITPADVTAMVVPGRAVSSATTASTLSVKALCGSG
jgi:hypothetical protein